jgi:uracil-DNA glycosylase family protein
MIRHAETAAPFVPHTRDLARLAAAARRCRGCELYKPATQVVFGRGLSNARIMMLGEQPGNQEDKQGEPFVGPAGKLLNRAIQDAGLSPDDLYISNVVKHFRFDRKGPLRLHHRPAPEHIRACRPWLEAEIEAIHPGVIVCLGVTAAQSVFQRSVTITSLRGKQHDHPWGKVIATVHPSSLLRVEDEAERHRLYGNFVKDLKLARKILG